MLVGGDSNGLKVASNRLLSNNHAFELAHKLHLGTEIEPS